MYQRQRKPVIAFPKEKTIARFGFWSLYALLIFGFK
jgi:hypothetical protein